MAQGPSVTLFLVPSPASFDPDPQFIPGHRFGNCTSFIGGTAGAVRMGNNYKVTSIANYLSSGSPQPGLGIALVVPGVP